MEGSWAGELPRLIVARLPWVRRAVVMGYVPTFDIILPPNMPTQPFITAVHYRSFAMPSLDPGSLSAITFDLYGTLLDLEATFAPGFESFLLERGSTLDAPEMVRTWEWAYLHEGMVNTLLGGPRTPFEQLRRTTLSQLFSQYGVAHKRDDIEELLGNRVTPTLFPDVIDALRR